LPLSAVCMIPLFFTWPLIMHTYSNQYDD
jgi:hypothetical protein